MNKCSLVLTGATGFLGSHLMAALLKQGYRLIILGRATPESTLSERIDQLLRWFGLEGCTDQLELVEIDFSKPRFGLSEKRYTELCATTDQIIHCASDTNFSERNRARVMAANVSNLQAILAFAADSRVDFFHYISTVYAVGVKNGRCYEQFLTSEKFNNVYEESKAEAESIIATHCRNQAIPFTIIRTSIVYGDSQTGRSLKFNALYFPVKSLQHIRDIYLNDIKNHGGVKSRQCDIFLNEDGFLHLPLRIYFPHAGTINLVSVDYFVTATLAVVANALAGQVYHLTSDTPPTVETLAVYCEQFLKIKGIEIVYGDPPLSHLNQWGQKGGGLIQVGRKEGRIMRNPPEELFDRFIAPYRPYLADQRMFARENSARATNGLAPPEFTYQIFERCMEFAVGVEWGKTLFTF